jgi:broad-specificity NMP kinase
VVVLRCHPLELERRLEGSRRSRSTERVDNVVAEATDLVFAEAVGRARRVRQVDTTDRAVASVASEVEEFVRSRVPGRRRVVDWLADPRVTEYLLDRAP